MNNATPDCRFYVAGGTMKPDAASYVRRRADEELFETILAGEFCYVLTPRQMGKSSLMARTALRLAETGIQSAQVDLTIVGSDKSSVTAEQWYYGVANRITRELKIPVKLGAWWQKRNMLPGVLKFTEFLSDVVLEKCRGKVVVFVDEIDSTIGLPFSDDFFAGIRACYNARATTPSLGRLTFVLLGVATPAQLITDPTRTPFNIGRGIELTDFTLEEARPLEKGLDDKKLLERVLYWTGGHPYLTQALCSVIIEQGGQSTARVDQVVEERFLSAQASKEEKNLKFVRDRLTQSGDNFRKVLQIYRRVAGGQQVKDRPASSAHAALKLSGVVKPDENGNLQVRNRIYRRVFTDQWVRREWRTVGEPQPFILRLQTASSNDAVPYQAYKNLRRSRAHRRLAEALLALYWDRRQERDYGLLTRFRSLTFKDDERTRREISELLGSDYDGLISAQRHSGAVHAVAFSPDSKTVLTGSDDHSARLWRTDTGAPAGAPMQHQDFVRAVAFSPDGETVLTGSWDKTARLWRADTGAPIGSPLQHEGPVRAVAFSPDGKTLLTSSEDKTARLWRADTGTLIGSPLQHQGPIYAAVFSPDGETVLTGSEDMTARLWRVDTGDSIGPPLQHQGLVEAVAFSPNGETVLTGSQDMTARLWRADSGAPVGSPLQHENWVDAVAFSPDGKVVLTGSMDHTARLWRAEPGVQSGGSIQHRGDVTAVAFSPDGKTLLTGSEDNTVQLWRADTGAPIGPPLRHRGPVWTVAFSPDGKMVLTGSMDHTARLWRAEPGVQSGGSMQHGDDVTAVVFSPDGKSVLTSSKDSMVRLWRADNGTPIGIPMRHQDCARALAFSPDGKTLITGGGDNMALLWETGTGIPIGTPLEHQGLVDAVALSPDGETVVTGSGDKTARLWRVDTGAPIGFPLKHEGPVRAVVFSPDGKTVLTGSMDKTARLWRADTGASVGSPLQHQDSVVAVAFSPDGKIALTGSMDKTARLWRADTGAPIGPLLQHQSLVDAVAFSPDGKTILTRSGDWIYISAWDDRAAVFVSAKFLPGSFPNGFRFPGPTGQQIQVLLRDPGNSIAIRSVDFEHPNASPIRGDPEMLLSEWQKKLGLAFDDQDRIVSRYSPETTQSSITKEVAISNQ